MATKASCRTRTVPANASPASPREASPPALSACSHTPRGQRPPHEASEGLEAKAWGLPLLPATLSSYAKEVPECAMPAWEAPCSSRRGRLLRQARALAPRPLTSCSSAQTPQTSREAQKTLTWGSVPSGPRGRQRRNPRCGLERRVLTWARARVGQAGQVGARRSQQRRSPPQGRAGADPGATSPREPTSFHTCTKLPSRWST